MSKESDPFLDIDEGDEDDEDTEVNDHELDEHIAKLRDEDYACEVSNMATRDFWKTEAIATMKQIAQILYWMIWQDFIVYHRPQLPIISTTLQHSIEQKFNIT